MQMPCKPACGSCSIRRRKPPNPHVQQSHVRKKAHVLAARARISARQARSTTDSTHGTRGLGGSSSAACLQHSCMSCIYVFCSSMQSMMSTAAYEHACGRDHFIWAYRFVHSRAFWSCLARSDVSSLAMSLTKGSAAGTRRHVGRLAPLLNWTHNTVFDILNC